MEYKNKNQVKSLKEFIALSLDDVHPKLDGKYPGIDDAITLFLLGLPKRRRSPCLEITTWTAMERLPSQHFSCGVFALPLRS